MTLDEWMADQGKTNAEVAASMGLDPSTISLLRRGKRNPSLKLMRRVAETTNGAVTLNDWAGECNGHDAQ